MNHPLVVNCLKDEYDIYIGRYNKKIGYQSIWHNPFKIGVDGTREIVIDKYIKYLATQPELLNLLPDLKGKRLGCYCVPLLCHGSILAYLSNDETIPDQLIF